MYLLYNLDTRLLGDGDTTTMNSEGESDESLTEESVSDYEGNFFFCSSLSVKSDTDNFHISLP